MATDVSLKQYKKSTVHLIHIEFRDQKFNHRMQKDFPYKTIQL